MKKNYLSSFPYICAIIFFVVVFFYKTFFYGLAPVPSDSLVGMYHPWRDRYSESNPQGIPFKNFLITDPVRQQIPWKKIVIDSWKKGVIPRWNAFSFSGTTLDGNIQSAVFYPFNILFLIFSFYLAWTFLIILQPLLSCLFMYFYLRKIKLIPKACFLGSIIWGFSGFSIAWLTWGTMIHVSLWLPLSLLAVEYITDSKFLHKLVIWAVVLVFSLCCGLFAGHIQICIYLYILTVIYFIKSVIQKRTAGANERKFFILRICVFIVSIVVTIIITRVQLAPLITYVRESSRVLEAGSWQKEGFFIPFKHAVQFFVPDFFGNPATLNYWGVWNYGEFIGYIGIVPMFFCIIALFFVKNKEKIFWAIILLIALLSAFPTIFAKLPFYIHVPIISLFQPTRYLVIVEFALAVLAAFGYSYWLSHPHPKYKAVSLFIIAFYAGLWLYVSYSLKTVSDFQIVQNFMVTRRNLILPTGFIIFTAVVIFIRPYIQNISYGVSFLSYGLLICTVFDLFRFGWKFTPFTPEKYFFPTTKTIEYLESQEKPFRIMSLDKRLFAPNSAGFYGIESIDGYDPLISYRYEEFMAVFERGVPDTSPPFGFNRIISLTNFNSPLLPLFNAEYILSINEIDSPLVTQVFHEGETRVYRYNKALPRAYFVKNIIAVRSREEVINKLFDMKFDPKTQAIVEGDLPFFTPLPVEEDANIQIDYLYPESFTIRTKSQNVHFLVISNMFYPGWHAKVDGAETQIFRTNYLFQGIVVPAGSHTIKLAYGR